MWHVSMFLCRSAGDCEEEGGKGSTKDRQGSEMVVCLDIICLV